MKKNFLLQGLYQVLSMLLPLITIPYISRILGAEGIGIYSYTYAIVNYFVLFAKMGIHLYGNRTIASVRGDKEKLSQTFWDLFLLHILFSVISLLSYAIYISIAISKYKMISIIQGIYIISQLIDISWFYFGLEKFKLTVSRNILVKALTLVFIFLFVRCEEDTWKYVAILSTGSVFGESITWLSIRRYVFFRKPNWKEIKQHIWPMIFFFVPSITVSLYTQMDKIFIAYFSSTEQVGYYENAEKITRLVVGVICALGTISFPHITNLLAKGEEARCKEFLKKSIKFVIWISIALAFGIAGVAGEFVPIFFGTYFSASIPILSVLTICIPFQAIAEIIRSQFLLPNHKDRAYMISIFCGAVTNIILNLIFIPRYGALGAVVGTVAAEMLVCITQMIEARYVISSYFYIKSSIPFLILGIVMYCCVRWIGAEMGHGLKTILGQVLIGGSVYFLGSINYIRNRFNYSS